MDYSDLDEPGGTSPEEVLEWAIIDEAEKEIRSAIAKTPKGVAIQAWTALSHIITDRALHKAAMAADIEAAIANEPQLEWSAKLVQATIKSLEAMEGMHGD